MEGMWSLVIFTLLAQGAVGMVILQGLFGGKSATTSKVWSIIALLLIAIGTLTSLAHLSDPFVSYFTITNAATSWLSLEIIAVSGFGLLFLGYVLCQKRWLLWLSGLAGAVLIYVMAQVYIIPNVPFWDSQLTLWIFATTTILLGASTLLAIELVVLLSEKSSPTLGTLSQAILGSLTGWKPLLIILAYILRMVLVPLQILRAETPINVTYLDGHTLFTGVGAGLLLFLLMRHALCAVHHSEQAGKGIARSDLALLRPYALCMMLFVWAGELCGRALFYQGYTWFGMW